MALRPAAAQQPATTRAHRRHHVLKVAIPLTESNRKQVEALKKRRGQREANELEGARAVGEKITATRIALAVKTGEGGKMFGAVTAADIHTKLAEAGVEVERKRIQL